MIQIEKDNDPDSQDDWLQGDCAFFDVEVEDPKNPL